MTTAARVLEQAQPLLGEPLSQALLPHEQAGGAAYERGARSSAAALLLVHAVPPCACPLALPPLRPLAPLPQQARPWKAPRAMHMTLW